MWEGCLGERLRAHWGVEGGMVGVAKVRVTRRQRVLECHNFGAKEVYIPG